MNRKNKLLSIQDAAERLNISVFTLRGWISQRRVQVVRLWRRVFIREDYIDHLIEANTEEPSRPRSAL